MKSKITSTEQQSIFVTAFKRCIMHWPLFAIFVTLAIGIAVAYYEFAPSSYLASAMLVIKDKKR